MTASNRVIVGISGASGVIFGVSLLQALAELHDVETHLVVTEAAEQTLRSELGMTVEQIIPYAAAHYDIQNIAAPIASGSFMTRGMVILPCSIKTLSGIAHSFSQNLLLRAADVTLKERRPLILGIRETPFHLGHLRLMTQAAEMGALIAPPIPSFYHHPQTVEDIIRHYLMRVFDWLQLPYPTDSPLRWKGS